MTLKKAVLIALLAAIGIGVVYAGYRLYKGGMPQALKAANREPGVFAGRWNNGDPQGIGITRIEIGRGLTGLSVRMWSKCEPQDCEWGSPTSYDNRNAAKGALSVVWDDGALRRTQQLSLLPDGRLRLQTRILDHTSRQQTEKIEYFARAGR
jgi:hypothetical protein